jgi:beta propeller repeat protein
MPFIKITNNPIIFNDLDFAISGTSVVWQDNDGNDLEIFYYNGRTTRQLTNNNFDDINPKISGTNIVWKGDLGNAADIYYYNGSRISQLTQNNVSTSFRVIPQISGRNAAWIGSDSTGQEIYFYNGSRVVQITNSNRGKDNVQISGNRVVWLEFDGSDREIFFYNGRRIIKLTNNNIDDFDPQISGNNITWESNNEIFFYNGSKTIQLTNNDFSEDNLQLLGNNVVWETNDGNDTEIFLYNGSRVIQLTNNFSDDRDPQISGNNVVWFGSDGNDFEVYLYNGRTTRQLTNNNIDDGFPKISGDNIVFARSTDGGTNNNLILFTPESSLPSLSINNLAVVEGINLRTTLTVRLSAASNSIVNVNYATRNGTAIAGRDYTAINGRLTFNPGETVKNIVVPILNNNLNERNETFTITLTNPSNATLTKAQGRVTITDTLRSSVSRTLPNGTENLILTGRANINGFGNSLNNIIVGNSGRNILNGRLGNDRAIGGVGNDTYYINSRADVVIETSTLVREIDSVFSSASYVLGNNLERLYLTGNTPINGVGNNRNNLLVGNRGRNILNGRSGNDRLIGGLGNDILIGESGNDILTGGAGSDRFTFTSRTQRIDRITDFTAVDTIAVSARGFGGGLNAGNVIVASQFVRGTRALDRGDRFIYNNASGALFFDPDGTGALAKIQIATLNNSPLLTNNDILVIA